MTKAKLTHIRSGRVIREYFSHYCQRNLTLIGLSFRPLHGGASGYEKERNT